MEGRHARFGFLEKEEKWDFDAGRLGENVYVTGYAHNPQTWSDVTDHDLAFLGESFRESHYYRKSIFHSNFAQLHLALNNPDAALDGADKALDYERRNQRAWEAKFNATQQITEDPVESEDHHSLLCLGPPRSSCSSGISHSNGIPHRFLRLH